MISGAVAAPWILEEIATNSASILLDSSIDDDTVKVIHFIRHAQGHHNVAGEANYPDYELEDYEDSELSPLGLEQCEEAASLYESVMANVSLIVVSMMRRCMQTATNCFPSLIHKKESVLWLANEDCREQTGSHPCDRRHSLSAYKISYPHIDFCDIIHENDPLYWKYGNDTREPVDDVLNRCEIFLKWLIKRPEKEIVICTHSAILGILIPYLIPNKESRKYNNAELRSYIFKERIINE